MLRFVMFIGSVLIATLLLSPISSSVYAAPKLKDDTPVVVAEDQTKEADCMVWSNSPESKQPCEPGSVIFARDTIYAEVKKNNIQEWAVLTNDPKLNDAIEQELVGKVRKRVHGTTYTALACVFTPNKSKSGSYLTIPNNPNSARVEYTFRYTIQGTCGITDAADYGRITANTLQSIQSCVDGINNCVGRNVIMNQNWSGPFALPNTQVGREYRHISGSPCAGCGKPYGINTFN